MKIFAISGLGADERAFKHLSLNHELVHISWVPSIGRESIIDYAKRLIEKHDLKDEKDFAILGLSFGGLVAVEISKILTPKFTVLISSAETKHDLNAVIKLFAKSKLVDIIPDKFFTLPKPVAHFLFGTDDKNLLDSFIDETDPKFTKWAVRELINWQNETKLSNLIKIGGACDKVLPQSAKNTILIEKGEHFVVVDKAEEVSKIINDRIEDIVGG